MPVIAGSGGTTSSSHHGDAGHPVIATSHPSLQKAALILFGGKFIVVLIYIVL